jgi:hypothetical protein
LLPYKQVACRPASLSVRGQAALPRFRVRNRFDATIAGFAGTWRTGKNRHACAVFPLKMLPKCKCEFVGLIYTFMPARFSMHTKSLNRYAFASLARFMQLRE